MRNCHARLLTLRAMGLEEPFPYHPTSGVFCHPTGTGQGGSSHPAATDRAGSSSIAATSKPLHGRLTCPARTQLTRLGLGGAQHAIQNASSCAGACELNRKPATSARVLPSERK